MWKSLMLLAVGWLAFAAAPCQAQVGSYVSVRYGYIQPGCVQPGYGYPQAATFFQYPPGPWKSYYNNPQWQQDWQTYMWQQSRGISTPGYMPGTLPLPGMPGYRSYFSDPEWQRDWRQYLWQQCGR